MSEVKRKNRMFGFVTETWSPLVGCSHNCVYCWARRQAQRQKKNCPKCGWFTPHLHKERLNRKFKPNTLVFVSDMGDLFCGRSGYEEIIAVLDVIRKYPQTTFFLETKNPRRMVDFASDIPKNVILSTTIETNFMCDKHPAIGLWWYEDISNAPHPANRYHYMTHTDLKAFKKHISIEPILEFDLDVILKWILNIKPEFGVSIGYDNYNHRLPEPPLSKTLRLIEILEKRGVKVERKTLRKAWWRK